MNDQGVNKKQSKSRCGNGSGVRGPRFLVRAKRVLWSTSWACATRAARRPAVYAGLDRVENDVTLATPRRRDMSHELSVQRCTQAQDHALRPAL